MKKAFKLSIVLLFVALLSACTAFAAPKGYKEVKLTKKNYKKYLEIKKVKRYDAFGDYDGYKITFKSKLLKKGYYICDVKNFAIKGTVKERYKYKYRGKTYKHTFKYKLNTIGFPPYLAGGSSNYNYSYAKVKKLKVSKIKGTIVFAVPSNIIKVTKKYYTSNKHELSALEVRVKYPYSGRTWNYYPPNSYKASGYYFNDYQTYGKTVLG